MHAAHGAKFRAARDGIESADAKSLDRRVPGAKWTRHGRLEPRQGLRHHRDLHAVPLGRSETRKARDPATSDVPSASAEKRGVEDSFRCWQAGAI